MNRLIIFSQFVVLQKAKMFFQKRIEASRQIILLRSSSHREKKGRKTGSISEQILTPLFPSRIAFTATIPTKSSKQRFLAGFYALCETIKTVSVWRLCVYRSQPSERERERVHVKAEPPLPSNASPEQQGRRRGLLVAFCHGKTRTSEPLCVLESGDALLARVASMQNAPCSILDMPFAVSVGDYDGSLRCVERFRGKWQVKRLVRLMILFSQDQVNSRRFFICRLDVLEISSNIFDSIFFS